MKRFAVLRYVAAAMAACVLSACFSSDANAQILRRNRGGGGNMGAGNGLCNMATCPVKPGECAGGACNLQSPAAPVAPAAPAAADESFRGDGLAQTSYRSKKTLGDHASRGARHQASGRHAFDFDSPDVLTAPPRAQLARR